jgi:hypothetical protein
MDVLGATGRVEERNGQVQKRHRRERGRAPRARAASSVLERRPWKDVNVRVERRRRGLLVFVV